MSKIEAGRKGGQTTFLRHGSSHMAEIGRSGAAAFWRKYTLKPNGISGWVVVDREAGTVVNSFQNSRLDAIWQAREGRNVDGTPF